MYPESPPKVSFEGSVIEDDLEESLLRGNTSQSSRRQHHFLYFNISFALLDILAAAFIYLSQPNILPASKADYGTLCFLSIPWRHLRLMIQGP